MVVCTRLNRRSLHGLPDDHDLVYRKHHQSEYKVEVALLYNNLRVPHKINRPFIRPLATAVGKDCIRGESLVCP